MAPRTHRKAKKTNKPDRPWGWGNYRQLASGSYELYYNVAGERVYEVVATDVKAIERLDEIWILKQSGRSDEIAGVPWSQLKKAFLKSKRTEVDGKTRRGYRDIIEIHFDPVFGNAKVHEFEYDVIVAYRDCKVVGGVDDDGDPLPELPVADRFAEEPGKRRGGRQPKAKLAPQTVGHHLELLHQMMELAVRKGWIDKNPVDGVSRPRVRRKQVTAYEREDALEFLALLDGGDPRMIAEVALALGVRFGEELAIRASDFKTKQGVWGVEISRSVKRTGRKAEEVVGDDVKSEDSERFLPVGPAFRARIEQHWERTAHYGVDPSGDPLLFRSPKSGRHLSASNFRNRHWLPALGTIALRRMNEVQLRRVLERVPAEFRLVAAVLAVTPDATLETVRHLTRENYSAATRTLRYVDCHGRQREVVLGQALAMQLDALERAPGKKSRHGLLFTGSTGQALSRDRFISAVFREAFEACEVDLMKRFHNMRHTYVTTLIELGHNDNTVAYRAGHKKGEFSSKVYGHVRRRLRQENADIYDVLMEDQPGRSTNGSGETANVPAV